MIHGIVANMPYMDIGKNNNELILSGHSRPVFLYMQHSKKYSTNFKKGIAFYCVLLYY
ncbi:hypothetical protein GBK2_36 [Geobacillus phage GBK2]|uniref:hypothetical protein n=1 Tax=Geobacillus phage GBK2 TaxID=1458842 RepID=UPI0003F1F5AD|nr:hypothetical protein GBK2_36 [Geobacillus phage GBK2]AHJ88634.1 hypothetical protein GBK2_36 [Geobacillus phage GBK2]